MTEIRNAPKANVAMRIVHEVGVSIVEGSHTTTSSLERKELDPAHATLIGVERPHVNPELEILRTRIAETTAALDRLFDKFDHLDAQSFLPTLRSLEAANKGLRAIERKAGAITAHLLELEPELRQLKGAYARTLSGMVGPNIDPRIEYGTRAEYALRRVEAGDSSVTRTRLPGLLGDLFQDALEPVLNPAHKREKAAKAARNAIGGVAELFEHGSTLAALGRSNTRGVAEAWLAKAAPFSGKVTADALRDFQDAQWLCALGDHEAANNKLSSFAWAQLESPETSDGDKILAVLHKIDAKIRARLPYAVALANEAWTDIRKHIPDAHPLAAALDGAIKADAGALLLTPELIRAVAAVSPMVVPGTPSQLVHEELAFVMRMQFLDGTY